MPATAISTGMVDWVLPVAQMPAKLMEFVRNEDRMQLPPEILEAEEPDAKMADTSGGATVSDETGDAAHEAALASVLSHLHSQTGHDFAHYKRATVLRRIARRLQVNSLETIPEYLEILRTHPAEARALLQDLLIGVTHFFRDRDAFAALEANIPQLFSGKKRTDQIRVWVAGCSTGEEAYSIAMLLSEHADMVKHPPSIQVFASDVDDQAIADAREGLFPATIEADVEPERLCHFFVNDHGRYRVRKEIREKVLFASHNLLKDAPFSRLDLVSCRNLLIYLNGKAQEQVLDIFHFALRSGGLLFIGSAESDSNAHSLFSAVDAKQRLYERRSVPRPSWKVPTLPLRSPEMRTRPMLDPRSRDLPPLLQEAVEEAGKDTVEARVSGTDRRAALFGELHLKLLEEYGPPSIVVNETHDIVHLSENAGSYLQLVAGEPSANLFKMMHPALRVELRTALFRASQDKASVKSAPHTVEIAGASEVIRLEVRPIRATDPEHPFYLVLFEKQSEAPATPPEAAKPDGTTREIEDENQYLKQQLATTVEQFEAGDEELKASNEELQSMNEEMRSSSEELETSKEELQSVNEELTTVNHQLKCRVEELSDTNTDLSNLMASTDIGTIFLDRQLRIQRFTPSAQRIFNLIAADMGRPLSDITHKLAYDGLLGDAEKVLADLATIEREVHVGEASWYLTRIAPYRTADDHIAGVVATFIDITQLKRAEEELRRTHAELESRVEERTSELSEARDEAQKANAAKSEFLSRMSHELRTPLNAILGFGELLQTEGRAPEEADNLDQVLKAGYHLLALVNEVLDISGIEGGRMEISLESLDVGEILRETLSLVRTAAASHKVTLHELAAEGCVLADPRRLKQVLLNLLANAVKFNGEGGSVSVSAETTERGTVRLTVRDTGRGIALQDAEKIFVPFERLDASAANIEGIGLGLSISRRLVEAMGGTIGLESRLGEGSAFWIELPRAQMVSAEGSDMESPELITREGEAHNARTLLYIEDNPSNLTLIERILGRRRELKLLSAPNAAQGLTLAREHRPDLILLDLHLPDIEGDKVLEQLRADPRTAAIPVVMISADATSAQIERMKAAGARDYLIKPINMGAFLAMVDRILKETFAQAGS